MRSQYRHFVLTLAAVAACLGCMGPAHCAAPPNIVFILADDLGSGDLGCYKQKKIRTPHIDQLAREGMRFTQHYSGNAVCAPSRCVLMTGKHPGHAWVRNNREVQPEGQFPLPADTVTVAKLLKSRGYATGAFGKWGLGSPESDGQPLKQGFDRFYGYNCQRQAHNYYPQTLWDNDHVTTLANPPIPLKAKLPDGADPNKPESYTPYTGKEYSADLIAEKARQFVRDNKDTPFFLYWPTTVPHLALQVPQDSLKQYAGRLPDEPYTGNDGYLPQMTPHAAYAAMITRLDREVGRMVDLLDELKLTSNTLVIFTSDNGGTHGRVGGADTEFFKSNGELRDTKGSLFEGGIRVPLIVRWKGHIAARSVCKRVTGFEDWLPTLTELAGVGSDAPQAVDGISFVPTLLGKQQPERPFLYREFAGYGGQQCVRVGVWKAIRQDLSSKKASESDRRIQLYNLQQDPSESTDVAVTNPEVVVRMEAIMREQHVPSADFALGVADTATTQASRPGS